MLTIILSCIVLCLVFHLQRSKRCMPQTNIKLMSGKCAVTCDTIETLPIVAKKIYGSYGGTIRTNVRMDGTLIPFMGITEPIIVKVMRTDVFNTVEYTIGKRLSKLGVGPKFVHPEYVSCNSGYDVLIQERLDGDMFDYMRLIRNHVNANHLLNRAINAVQRKVHRLKYLYKTHGDFHGKNVMFRFKDARRNPAKVEWFLIDFGSVEFYDTDNMNESIVRTYVNVISRWFRRVKCPIHYDERCTVPNDDVSQLFKEARLRHMPDERNGSDLGTNVL